MSKEQMVGSRLPPELVSDLELIEKVEHADRSTTIRKLLSKATREWKQEYYARQYAEGKFSLARAAREAGVSLWEMMEYVRARKIPAQYDFEEWERDLQTVYRQTGIKREDQHG